MPPVAPPSAPDHVVVAPLAGRSGAYLTLRDPASRLDVSLGSLPGQLFRVTTPAGSGLAPAASVRDGHAEIRLRPTGGSGRDAVRVVLNRDVRWSVRLPAGSGETGLDLTGGRVTRLETGGPGLLDATLPAAGRPFPLVVTGATGSARIRTAAPLRIALPSGAGTVTTPWTVRNGVPSGTWLAEPAGPGRRCTITFKGGVGDLTVTRS